MRDPTLRILRSLSSPMKMGQPLFSPGFSFFQLLGTDRGYIASLCGQECTRCRVCSCWFPMKHGVNGHEHSEFGWLGLRPRAQETTAGGLPHEVFVLKLMFCDLAQ